MRFQFNIPGMDYAAELARIFETRALIQDIHPFLRRVFPVAIAEDDRLMIFDAKPGAETYFFAKEVTAPMPIPPGVRAAFPLEAYDNRMACVVTADIFDDLGGYVTIFHEFIHCQQFETCEPTLKQKLSLARRAQAENDMMWEISYPFPYTQASFIRSYTAFLAAVGFLEVEQIRKQLKDALTVENYEYMVWQEWKEGFARYIENALQRRLGLPENLGGSQPPFGRVAFYAGGARLIRLLEQQEPRLVNDIQRLFERMAQESVE